MPNGGDDNCATCQYNGVEERNSLGYPKDDVESITCQIRDIEITDLGYTYCANHPGHNPEQTRVPIGPIWRNRSSYVGDREPWHPSPDSEEIRLKLLTILDSMSPVAPPEHYGWPGLDEVVIFQLGEFRERRAVNGIQRTLGFDPLRKNEREKTRTEVIMRATVALARILGDEAYPDLLRCYRNNRSRRWWRMRRGENDAEYLSAVRASVIEACELLSPHVSEPLLREALKDSDERNSSLAERVLHQHGTAS